MLFLTGVPSAYQQKRIRDLNSTLQKEQLEVLQFKDRMIMVIIQKGLLQETAFSEFCFSLDKTEQKQNNFLSNNICSRLS